MAVNVVKTYQSPADCRRYAPTAAFALSCPIANLDLGWARPDRSRRAKRETLCLRLDACREALAANAQDGLVNTQVLAVDQSSAVLR